LLCKDSSPSGNQETGVERHQFTQPMYLQMEDLQGEKRQLTVRAGELEERVQELEGERLGQEERIRDVEERYEESQREVADYAAEVQRYRSQLDNLRTQMVEATKLKTRSVSQDSSAGFIQV
jgi:chromosome segregation ATPase